MNPNPNAYTKMKLLMPALVLALVGCSKSDMNLVSDDCMEITSNSSFGFYVYSYPSYRYIWPYFNPNNSDEFIYTQVNTETGTNALYKYDLTTHVSTYLTGEIGYRAKWGKMDWIAVTKADGDIWKLKSNGDSLTRICSECLYCDYPNWNNRGDKFIYRAHYGDSINTIVSDLYGNTIYRTNNVFFEDGAWAPSGDKLIFPSALGENYGITLSDTNLVDTEIIKFMDSQYGDDVLQGMDWLADLENVIWATKNTVSITNIHDGVTSQLLSNCDSKHYVNPSVSPDGTKVLFELVQQTKISEVELYIENKIVIMNINGTGEMIILE